jgi:hypothetical protein
MSLVDIHEGIARQFEPTGLRCSPFMPNTIVPPAFFLFMRDQKPSTMRRGWFELLFNGFLFVSSATDRAGQELLFRFLSATGSESVWETFGNNNDLDMSDGTSATLDNYRSLSIEELAAYPYYGGVLEIRVTTPGV